MADQSCDGRKYTLVDIRTKLVTMFTSMLGADTEDHALLYSDMLVQAMRYTSKLSSLELATHKFTVVEICIALHIYNDVSHARGVRYEINDVSVHNTAYRYLECSDADIQEMGGYNNTIYIFKEALKY